MSGSTIGSLAGAGIGALVGGPGGARVGWMIGGTLGGIVKPDQIKGPRLSDGQTVTSQEGIPIPFGFGTFPTGGNCIWADVLVEHKHKEGGKGGPVTTTYTYTRSYAIGICEGEITAIAKVWRNGKLVYDITPGSALTAENAKFLENHTFYTGSETQLVDPTIEAVVGVGNSPPMRGLAYMVAENEDLSESAGAIAQWRFVVQMCGTVTNTTGDYLMDLGPEFYYKLDGDGVDATGNHPALVPGGPTVGWGGNGLLLPSTADHASVVQGSGLEGTTTLTILARCRVDNIVGGSVVKQILSHINNSVLGYYSWSLHLIGPNKMTPQVGINHMGGAGSFAAAPFDVAVSEDFVMALRRNGATLDIAINGDVVGSGACSGSFSGAATFTAGGGRYFPASAGLVGSVGPAVGYRFALTDDQLADASLYLLYEGAGYVTVPDVPGAYIDPDGNLITTFVPSEEVSSCGADLADIVASLCERAGIEPSEYDVTDLAGIEVKGYGCATESSAQGFIEPLTQAFFFDRGEWDKKVRFIPRGGASVASLDPDDLVAMDGPAIVQTRVQEVELLRKVNVMTVDPEAEFNVTKQSWERRIGTIQAKGEASVEIPIVTDHDTAAQIAEKRGKVAWAETDKFAYGLTLAHSALTPTDVVTLTDKAGVAHRQRLQAQNEESGVITIEEAMKDRASTYSSTATGVQNPNLPTQNDGQIVGPTLFAAMALPMLRSQDNTPGLYVGLAGMLEGWPGAQLLMSVDGGLSYSAVLTVTVPTILGELTADEDSNGEPFSVRVFGGALESKTTAQVDVGANWSAIETAGVAEIIAYETATPTGDVTYDLTDVTRALDETVYASHNAGDPFMDLSTAYFLPISQSLAGTTLYFKAVGFGVSADAVDPVAVAWAGVEYVEDGGLAS